MSDDAQFELTRRKALAGLGTIGAASALGGAGTAAFFSDEENFRDNRLVAGELDLKVDWEEHYSDWSDDEADAPSDGSLDIRMDLDGINAADYTAFPPGVEAYDGTNSEPLLYVRDEDVAQFMDNTSVEAFPDSDNDGVQDEFDAANACDVLADVGANDSGLDPTGPRTDGDDTRLDNGNGGAAPLINLNDVKPGDFGELTLSFHLCANPGYVWLNAGNFRAQENGTTEPEAEDDDEDGPDHEDSTDVENARVELLDAVQTAWWYDDNCNNLTDGGSGGSTGADSDVALVLDNSGSIDSSERDSIVEAAKAFIDELAAGDQAATVAFGSTAAVEKELTQLDTQSNITDVKDAIENYGTISGSSGSTNIDGALEAADGELESSRARQSANPVIVLLSDGSPTANNGIEGADNPDISDDDDEAAVEEADQVKASGKRIISLGFGFDTNDDEERAIMKAIAGTTANSESEYADFESGSGDDPDDEGDYFAAPEPQDLEGQFEDIAGAIGQAEEIFFQGSLRAALTALTSGDGIPLDGNAGDDFDETSDDATADARGCFEPTPATNCIGFSWWLPVDHANEIQTDSVSFDLGFYTEQCRHNTGSGDTRTTSES